MSNRRKNNHYHYAEKFDDRRRVRGRTAFVPFKSLIISLIVLLMFGVVSTSFAVYISDNGAEYDPEDTTPSLIIQARNLKESRDVAMVGADGEIAFTGETWSFSGGYVYFDNTTTNWNTTYVYLVIGKSTYSSVYSMTKITNTNYYYCSFPSNGWRDAEYMAFIGSGSTWNDGNWGSGNLSNATKRTGTYTAGITTSSNQRYIMTPSSSANGCSISLSYQGTDNSSMDIISLKAHACYTNNGSSYTSDNSTGGTVNITSYYFAGVNSIASSSTGASATATYSAAKTTNNSTFTATKANGYEFQGWYSSATGGSLVSSSASYSYSTKGGNNEIYARFIKQYTVTAANPSDCTITAPTAGGEASATVNAGNTVTLSATVPTGVSFSGWTFSSNSYTFSSGYSASSNPCVIKPTGNITATAGYTLSAPTISKFTYSAKNINVNSTPSITATSATGLTNTLSRSFTIAKASGTTAAAGTYSVNSSGDASASTPGKYTVTLTVTDSAYGLNATKTKTATATFKPLPPTPIEYAVNGYTDAITQTSGTVSTDPYKIPIKYDPADSNFSIRAYIPEEDRISGYTYYWTMKDGSYDENTYAETDGSLTMNHGNSSSSQPDTMDEAKNFSPSSTLTCLHVDTAGYYYYKTSLIARYNGVDSDATTSKVYYTVITDYLSVESYEFSDDDENKSTHKIYAEDNDITSIIPVYDTGLTSFHTILFFSGDNLNWSPLEVWTGSPTGFSVGGTSYTATPNDSDHATSDLVEIFNVAAQMGQAGVKYFKSYISDAGGSNVGAATPWLHTTVGTTSSGSEKPLYFVDDTGNTFSPDTTRLMAFFLDSSNNLTYQTGQDMTDISSLSGTYRFYAPSDAVSVTFMYVDKDYYIIPTAGNGVISYTAADNSYYKAVTPTLSLTADPYANTYTADAYTTGSNSVLQYSGTMSALN